MHVGQPLLWSRRRPSASPTMHFPFCVCVIAALLPFCYASHRRRGVQYAESKNQYKRKGRLTISLESLPDFQKLRLSDFYAHAGDGGEVRSAAQSRSGLKEGNGGLIGPYWTVERNTHSLQVIEKNGGDDETRTRDLCRDRAAF
jgi:hypothetical protein